MTYESSRIPIPLVASATQPRSRLTFIALVVVTSAALALTTLAFIGVAHAERSTTPKSIATAPAAPIQTISDIQNELNRIRAEKQLGPLVFDSILTETSQRWADTMADENRLRHDPDLVASYQDGWTTLGESIASGSTGDAAYAGVVANRRQAAQIFSGATNNAGIGLTAKNGHVYLVVRLAAQTAE